MRAARYLLLVTLAVSACGPSSTAPSTPPSAAVLTMSLSPNPLPIPAAGERLTWNVTITEKAGIGVTIDRDETNAIDAAGDRVVQREGFWRAPQPRVQARGTVTWNGMTAAFLGPPRAATLAHIVYYTDDRGNSGMVTASVPVQ